MLERILGITMLVGIVAVVGITTLTTPASIGPVGILALFASGYATLVGLLSFALHYASRSLAYLLRPVTVRRPLGSLSLRRSYLFSTVFALAPIMLVGMQSVGDIGVYETILVVLFLVISSIYVARKTA